MPNPSRSRTARWQTLGRTELRQLPGSRLALHQATQLLASFGQSLVAARDDDSHRAMTWHPAPPGFLSQPTTDGLQARLTVSDFSLELLRHGTTVAKTALSRRTLKDGRRWLEGAVADARRSSPVALAWPEYDLPTPPGGAGAPLEPEPQSLVELSRWYANGHLALGEVLAGHPEASAIRCWPHHFDLATLLSSPPQEGGGEACSVGVGLSPGDGAADDPYFYVNAWPSPNPDLLPEVAGPGHWHTEGWVGAVLPAAEVVRISAAEGQAALVGRFLSDAVAMLQGMMGRGEPGP